MDGREDVGEIETVSIGAAIRQAVDIPMPGLAGFHLWYEHVCAGTVTAGEMRSDAEALAERLVALHGLFRA